MQRSNIILNATAVQSNGEGLIFEFSLDDALRVVSGVYQDDVSGKNVPIMVKDYWDALFEFNYISIQSKGASSIAIRRFTQQLEHSGIALCQPSVGTQEQNQDCNLLGELPDMVRFYIKPNEEIVFLSPASRLRLVAS